MTLEPNKIWCKKCYEGWCTQLDEKYGKGGWYFSNMESRVNLKEDFDVIGYPPSLNVKVKYKKKNGEYSDSKTREISLVSMYCPFCGKPIAPQDIEEDENE